MEIMQNVIVLKWTTPGPVGYNITSCQITANFAIREETKRRTDLVGGNNWQGYTSVWTTICVFPIVY